MSSDEAGGRTGGLSFRLGGIPVLMPWSSLLGIGIIAFLWLDWFVGGSVGRTEGIVLTVVFALLFYASILGHELAHAWVASAAGYPVRSITLWWLGGFTSYERRTTSAWREGLIAASGPASSILIGLAAWVVYAVADGADPRVRAVAYALAWSNVLLGIYNALPGLPLDGGAVLKSIVWGITRDENRGTVVAAWGGRVVAVVVLLAFVAPAFLAGRAPDFATIIFAAIISAFLWSGASQALSQARISARVPALSARVLARRAVLVPQDTPLSEALRQVGEAGAGGVVLTDAQGRAVAVSQEAAVSAVPVERRPWVPVSSVSAALDPRAALPADLVGEPLLVAMQAHPASEYIVVEPDGRLVGVLSTADVEAALTR
jgi:Zn-dependent protease/CBS domain-containing protein